MHLWILHLQLTNGHNFFYPENPEKAKKNVRQMVPLFFSQGVPH